ncbi:Uncharacterised protein [uncultured archaeon]|nr:Uncharacterised protein [uncultured archaeon]
MSFYSGFIIYSNSLEKNALFLKPEFKLDLVLNYSHETAFKSFEQGKNTARDVNLEWLIRIAGTKQIFQALELTKPIEKMPCLFLSERPFKAPKTIVIPEKTVLKDLWEKQKNFFHWNGSKEALELDLIEQRALMF